MGNLRTLCRSCHSRKTVMEEQGGAFGHAARRKKA
jgi:5-methylcytosine-specific restriction endonuclease McrA